MINLTINALCTTLPQSATLEDKLQFITTAVNAYVQGDTKTNAAARLECTIPETPPPTAMPDDDVVVPETPPHLQMTINNPTQQLRCDMEYRVECLLTPERKRELSIHEQDEEFLLGPQLKRNRHVYRY